MKPLPASREDLTPELFTSMLGLSKGSRVESVELQRLGESDSVSGYIYRAKLTYNNKAPDAPESVVLKLPQPRSLRTDYNIESYKTEVMFYRDLALKVGVPVPKHIYSDIDAETGDYILVIQDFPKSRNISNEAGATKEQAYKLIENLAKLHALNWSNQELGNKIPSFDNSIGLLCTGLSCLPVFLSRFSQYIQPEDMEVFRMLPGGFKAAVQPLMNSPKTIVHNDYAVKNILAVDQDGVTMYVLIDWANLRWGPGARDLSHFMRTSVPSHIRSACEWGFLRYYWVALVSMGVSGYSFEQLSEDYRRCVIMDMARMAYMGGREYLSPVYESIVRQGILSRAGSARTLDLGSIMDH